MLQDVLIIMLDCGVRVLFPRRGVLNSGPVRPGADQKIRRPACFPDPNDWAAFSERALAAIEAAFPGKLMHAASRKVLPPRPQLPADYVTAIPTHNEVSFANVN